MASMSFSLPLCLVLNQFSFSKQTFISKIRLIIISTRQSRAVLMALKRFSGNYSHSAVVTVHNLAALMGVTSADLAGTDSVLAPRQSANLAHSLG